jgi:flagellar biosynthesis protein
MEKKKEIKQAIALRYEDGDAAPKVVAQGKGEAAEKILEIANENDVPIHEDAALAQTLGTLALGSEIPSELYEIVAQILVFVSDMDKLYARR